MSNVTQTVHASGSPLSRAVIVAAAFTVGVVGFMTSMVMGWLYWVIPSLRPSAPQPSPARPRPAVKPSAQPKAKRQHARPPPLLLLPFKPTESVELDLSTVPESHAPSVTLPPSFEVIRPKPLRPLSFSEPSPLPTPPPSRGSSILCAKAKARKAKTFLARNDPPSPTAVYRSISTDVTSPLSLPSDETLISEGTPAATATPSCSTSMGLRRPQIGFFGRRPSTAPGPSRPSQKRSHSTGAMVRSQEAESGSVDEFGEILNDEGKPVGRSATTGGVSRKGKRKDSAHGKMASESDKSRGRFAGFSLRPSRSVRTPRIVTGALHLVSSPETMESDLPSTVTPSTSLDTAVSDAAHTPASKSVSTPPNSSLSPSSRRRRFSSLFGPRHSISVPPSALASSNSPIGAPVPRTKPYEAPYNVPTPIAGGDVTGLWTRRKRMSAPSAATGHPLASAEKRSIDGGNGEKEQSQRRESLPAVGSASAPVPSVVQ